MKILTFILSIYILTLNFIPCDDNSGFNNSSKTELVQLQDVEHQHSVLDLCSPFCHCQCCQVHAAGIGMIEIEAIATEISSEVFFHIDNLGKDFSNLILQPPRV